MMLGELDWYMQNKNEIKPPTYIVLTLHQNKLKWIKDLSKSHNTMKILKENIGSKISYILCTNIFVDISYRARETKEKINEWDYIN